MTHEKRMEFIKFCIRHTMDFEMALQAKTLENDENSIKDLFEKYKSKFEPQWIEWSRNEKNR